MVRFVLPVFAAVLWSGTTVFIMVLYARSMLGPTPLYLPIFFAIVSFVGVVISLKKTFLWKIEAPFLIVSGVLFFIALLWHLKFFLEILYVS